MTDRSANGEDTAAADPWRGLDDREQRRLGRAVWLGIAAVRLVAPTWRFRLLARGPVDALRAAGRPIVFSFWHGQMLPLLWLHRNEGVGLLISTHRDGEIIARIAEHFGFTTVRGSSNRSARRALLGLVQALREGRDVAVTPDGPRGPARRFAPGAVVAAQRAAAPIVAVGVAASRAWRLRSWDRFLIPKPFARVTVAYSAPTVVDSVAVRDAAGEAPRFERLLNDAEALASR